MIINRANWNSNVKTIPMIQKTLATSVNGPNWTSSGGKYAPADSFWVASGIIASAAEGKRLTSDADGSSMISDQPSPIWFKSIPTSLGIGASKSKYFA